MAHVHAMCTWLSHPTRDPRKPGDEAKATSQGSQHAHTKLLLNPDPDLQNINTNRCLSGNIYMFVLQTTHLESVVLLAQSK